MGDSDDMDEPRGDLFNGARPFIIPPVFFDDPPPSGGKGPYKIKHVFNLICICDKTNAWPRVFDKVAENKTSIKLREHPCIT